MNGMPEKDETRAGDSSSAEEEESPPAFILYKDGPSYGQALYELSIWVNKLLVPVYAREATSSAPWCPRWWEHPEAVAQLHGLWMAWQDHTGPGSNMSGPATWHRDFLGPIMNSLRSPSGPFAGCKRGVHRAKEAPYDDTPG